MEINQIRYFLALAEELNFSRAAERCGVSQPSLTRAIKRLEEDLGAQLVRRERNRTHLTELGRRIQPRLLQALSLTEIAQAEANDFARMSRASLNLGVMCTIGPCHLISLVEHITCEFPQLKLTLRTASGNEVINWLLAGDIDVAIVGLPDYPDTIAVQELYKERYMVAFPKAHRFSKLECVPLKAMQGEHYLERLNCEYMQFFESELSDLDETIFKQLEDSLESMEVRHESEHEDWIQAMIIAGIGCSVLPQYMSLYPELQMRPLVDPEIFRTIGLATVRGREHTPIVSVFCDMCRNMDWVTNATE